MWGKLPEWTDLQKGWNPFYHKIFTKNSCYKLTKYIVKMYKKKAFIFRLFYVDVCK